MAEYTYTEKLLIFCICILKKETLHSFMNKMGVLTFYRLLVIIWPPWHFWGYLCEMANFRIISPSVIKLSFDDWVNFLIEFQGHVKKTKTRRSKSRLTINIQYRPYKLLFQFSKPKNHKFWIPSAQKIFNIELAIMRIKF